MDDALAVHRSAAPVDDAAAGGDRGDVTTDPPLPLVFDAATASAAGLSRHCVQRRVRTRRWVVLRRGVFCTRVTWDQASRRARVLLRVRAAVMACEDDGVVSHLSAAAMYGWPLPLGASPAVTLTTAAARRSTRYLDGVRVMAADLWPDETVRRSGILVTAPARTVADCLRHLDAPDAVALADFALRTGAVNVAQAREAMARQARWPHAARARSTTALVDPRRESWLESWSFTRLAGIGIEPPEPQVTVLDASGAVIGRVDGAWLGKGTVAEADGRGKYLAGLDARAALDPSEAARVAALAVMREKVREDRLRDTGLEVVRWGTADATRALPSLEARIRAAWERARGRGFTGALRLTPRGEPLRPGPR